MVSNVFELVFWLVLMAIMFMLGSLISQSKLDNAKSVIAVLEHEKEKLEDRNKITENVYDSQFWALTKKTDYLSKEIDRLHRKYGD